MDRYLSALRFLALANSRLSLRYKLAGAERSVFAWLFIVAAVQIAENLLLAAQFAQAGRSSFAADILSFNLALAGLFLVLLPGTARQSVNADQASTRLRFALLPVSKPGSNLFFAASLLRGALLPLLSLLYLAAGLALSLVRPGTFGKALLGFLLAMSLSLSLAAALAVFPERGPRTLAALVAKGILIAAVLMNPKFRVADGILRSSLFSSLNISFNELKPIVDVMTATLAGGWKALMTVFATMLVCFAAFLIVARRGGEGRASRGSRRRRNPRFFSRLPLASFLLIEETIRLEPLFLLLGAVVVARGLVGAGSIVGPYTNICLAGLFLVNAWHSATRRSRFPELFARLALTPVSERRLSAESLAASLLLFAVEAAPLLVLRFAFFS